MIPGEFDKASLPGVAMEVQLGDDHVYKVGGTMFAITGSAGKRFSDLGLIA